MTARARVRQTDFMRLVEILAPGKGDLVLMIEAYFDESYNDAVFCVSGYVFTKLRCGKLDSNWRKLLRKYHLPYFRMSECHARKGAFDESKISPDECLEVEIAAIELIKRYASFGVACVIDPKKFEKYFAPIKGLVTTPYDLAVWSVLLEVRRWADDQGLQGGIAHFFESGHNRRGSADKLMQRLLANPNLKGLFRYSSHGFVLKEMSPPAQAADLLAWQVFKERQRIYEVNEGSTRPPRKDFKNLIGGPVSHALLFPEQNNFAEFAADMKSAAKEGKLSKKK